MGRFPTISGFRLNFEIIAHFFKSYFDSIIFIRLLITSGAASGDIMPMETFTRRTGSITLSIDIGIDAWKLITRSARCSRVYAVVIDFSRKNRHRVIYRRAAEMPSRRQ